MKLYTIKFCGITSGRVIEVLFIPTWLGWLFCRRKHSRSFFEATNAYDRLRWYDLYGDDYCEVVQFSRLDKTLDGFKARAKLFKKHPELTA